MKVRSLGFRTDLLVRRLAGATVVDHPSHRVVRTPANPFFWWGNFVLVAPGALRDAPGLFAAEFPNASHVAIGVDTTEGGTVRRAEWEGLGMDVEIDSVLTASSLRAPARPARADLRPLAGDDWERVARLRHACEGPEPSREHAAFLAAKLAEERRLCEAGAATWFGAFVDGELRAGLGVVRDGRGVARYQRVETHPEFRRRGLASSLVHHAGTDAMARGARTLVIVAEPRGPAIGVYRSLGFVESERQVKVSAGV
ncbi:GNAT family N-acetyltransferase [Actinomadura chibensis]|uniref:GNAT family N-acetyltransferase n=1 Tax=Actinomadura chibensis TaxID=392828 RepID=A0A5D0NTK7_9ACTN|nr:GNAT family N-acetyltransferase [Actinomadura chibensis]TYB47973.1 GNAT family N-acetyltransferase [Actinomadura chibensis]